MKTKKEEWDRIGQSLYECFNSALSGLKRLDYITLDEYEHIIQELQKCIKEPKD